MNNKTRYVLPLALCVGIILLVLCGLMGMSRLLVKERPTTHADVIVVLSGDLGERVREGVACYQEGLAPKLLMTGGVFLDGTMADAMAQYAERLGVPSRDILVETHAVSTYTNATGSLPILQEIGAKRVLLVTSRFHTARAYRIFREVLPPDMVVFVRGADDGVDWGSWWKHGEMAETVLIEFGKTVYYSLKY